ncbi:MAG: hypothetical protein KY466_09625, partial [Gemmatimonadetes bacterium]|nr:hypothetical protein [Gemmatimonadota bacterium]
EHRGMIDASVFRYTTTMRQRLSVGVRAFRRDRIVYRRETAAHIDWRRDGPGIVEVVGARAAMPLAIPGVRIPGDLEEFALEMVPRPGADQLVMSPTGGGLAWHPLLEGGEAVYTYAIGDRAEIRLPNGRTVRLIELRVTPRERDIRYVTGSFWIDEETHGIVRAVYRPSREFDLERDLARIDPDEEDDADEVPDLFKPVKLDVRYMSVEYALWEMRWWMPRHVILDASLQTGPARFPVSFEIAYSDYVVEADRHGLPELPPVIRQLAGDPTARARPFEHGVTVVVPDSTTLLDSPLLPPSIYDSGGLVTEEQLRELARSLGALPSLPWQTERPRFAWPWQLGRGLLRYNRVEGLSAGARMDVDFGRARVDLTGRLGTADLEPRGELGVEVPTLRRVWRAAAYHRLAAADPGVRPFDLGSSLNAILLGRDDGSYFSASGAELRVTPAPGERAYYDARLYAERQKDVDRRADFSARRLMDPGWRFPGNIDADPATQVGLAAGVARSWGLDPAGLRWGLRLEAAAETGDYTFLRPGLTASAGFPLPGPLLGAVEVAGGTTLSPDRQGRPGSPRQSFWYIGGPRTVRGFGGAAAAGPDYARARLEAGSSFPAARLALFSDAGWAGDARTLDRADALLSVGAGASFLDGLLRFDLARAVQPEIGWRLDLYVDALF